MSFSRALRLGAPALAALLVPACSNNNNTITDVPRAAITVTVDPNPVPPSQNVLTGSVSIGYKITITEIAGLGGTMQFVSSQVYDPATGQLVSLTYFDSDDLVVFVGNKRIEPNGTLVVPQTGTYILPDLTAKATLTVSVQMKDDRDNIINQSQLVKVE
jgi:hypothetical protein